MLCHDALPELGCLKLGQNGVVAAPTPTPPNFCADRTSGIWNNLAVRTLWRAFFEDNSSHVNGGLRSTQELKKAAFPVPDNHGYVRPVHTPCKRMGSCLLWVAKCLCRF